LRVSFFAPAILEILAAIVPKEKLFFVFFPARASHNRPVTIALGATLNATGIMLGAIFGLALRTPISAQTQLFFRNALGALTIFFGFYLIWTNLNGTFFSCLGQLFIALLAVVLGNLLGKLLGLQKISNLLGRLAAGLIAAAQRKPAQSGGTGFNACTILFCVAPLGILGAINDGLSGFFWLLAVKALMDALAMMSFVKLFRWPAVLSALPVFFWFSLLTLGCRLYAVPSLGSAELIDSIGAASGLVTLAIAMVIYEYRKVELANYLPALAVAPLLAWVVKSI
jgi:uncharacterized membrane protein YqgA involved in biofilm formation